jgi:hypothetical protein
MPLFRRKPDEPTDAEQFKDWANPPRGVCREILDDRCYVVTAQGTKVYVKVGEWIAKEKDGGGGFYPIADHVMQKSFEEIPGT